MNKRDKDFYKYTDKEYNPCYTIHLNSNQNEDMDLFFENEPYIQTVCIDPGIENYGITITRRHRNGLIETIGELISFNYKTKKLKKKNNVRFGRYSSAFGELNCRLDKYLNLFEKTHYFLIENQCGKRLDMVKIMQHTISYFQFISETNIINSIVVEISSVMKSRQFGIHHNAKIKGKNNPYHMNYYQLKLWSKKTSKLIYMDRGDERMLECISLEKKQDDLSDTTMLEESFFRCSDFDNSWIPLSRSYDEDTLTEMKEEINESGRSLHVDLYVDLDFF